MRKPLRIVAEVVVRDGIDFLRPKSDFMAGFIQKVFEPFRAFFDSTASKQGLSHPEVTDSECTLASLDPVFADLVPVDEPIASQFIHDRLDGSLNSRRVRRTKSERGKNQEAGIQVAPAKGSGISTNLRIESMFFDRGVNFGGDRPKIMFCAPLLVFGQIGDSRERHPGQDFGMSVVLSARARLPNPLIGKFPEIDDRLARLENHGAGFVIDFPEERGKKFQCLDDFSVDVELE